MNGDDDDDEKVGDGDNGDNDDDEREVEKEMVVGDNRHCAQPTPGDGSAPPLVAQTSQKLYFFHLLQIIFFNWITQVTTVIIFKCLTLDKHGWECAPPVHHPRQKIFCFNLTRILDFLHWITAVHGVSQPHNHVLTILC